MKTYKTMIVENIEHKNWYFFNCISGEEYQYSHKEKSLEDIILEMNNEGFWLSAIEPIGVNFLNRYYFTKERIRLKCYLLNKQ